MPLPAALAARLAKRGILKNQSIDESDHDINKAQEEIIAEDYDDNPQSLESQSEVTSEHFEKFQGWFACPNKWNVYHECTSYCCKRWNEPLEIGRKYIKCRVIMLQKYPLPPHWQEVLEPGLGRYYYWNTETDLVSWLPPGHPRCQVSRSAAELRKHMITERNERLRGEEDHSVRRNDGKGSDFDDSSDEDNLDFERDRRVKEDGETSDSSMDSLEERRGSRKSKNRRDRERERGRDVRDRDRRERDSRRPKRRMDDSLDPMDPAAYSDCGRGNWASGLPQRNEARTGVDTTASGPLFQMRPYPNPGAVLRANAQAGGIGPKKG